MLYGYHKYLTQEEAGTGMYQKLPTARRISPGIMGSGGFDGI